MNLSKPTIHRIFGPPGTGKTTRLIGLMSDKLAEGVSPERICFITFTVKASEEAKERIYYKFKQFSPEQFVWVRTLHSLAFKVLGVSGSGMIGRADFEEVSRLTGFPLVNTWMTTVDDNQLSTAAIGDRILFHDGMYRQKMMTVKEYYSRHCVDEPFSLKEFEFFARTFNKYKNAKIKLDYTDLLYHFLSRGKAPLTDILFVDEAQDLSILQWACIKKLFPQNREVFIAGDDDQAIFEWAGADVQSLLGLESNKDEVLPHSYRVPGLIQATAQKVISLVKNRVPKEWSPVANGGRIYQVDSIEEIDMRQGEWMVLVRNAFLIPRITRYFFDRGYVFASSRSKLDFSDALRAIYAYEVLLKKKNQAIDLKDAKLVYSHIGKEYIKKGHKRKLSQLKDDQQVTLEDLKRDFGLLDTRVWKEQFTLLNPTVRNYFLTAHANGHKLYQKPTIVVDTIHRVKGGETDHVVLIPDMAARAFNEMMRNPEPELRTWYVAITRARQSVTFVRPRSSLYFDFAHILNRGSARTTECGRFPRVGISRKDPNKRTLQSLATLPRKPGISSVYFDAKSHWPPIKEGLRR